MCLDKSLEGHEGPSGGVPHSLRRSAQAGPAASDRGYRAFLARLDQDYARSRVWTSENSPSTHSGE